MKPNYTTMLKTAAIGLSLLTCTMTSAISAETNYTIESYYRNFIQVDFPNDNFIQLLGVNNNSVIAGYHGKDVNGGFTLTIKNNNLGFIDVNYPGASQTQVVAINDNGITGGFYVKNNRTHGFVRGQGKYGQFFTLDKPNTRFNQILGLNNNGYAVGYSSVYPAGDLRQRAFYFNGQKFKDLTPVLPTKVTHFNSQATGINAANWICGFYETQPGIYTGFLYHDDAVYPIHYPGSVSTQALGMNNKGQIVGWYTESNGHSYGFLYDNGYYYGPIRAFPIGSGQFGATTVVNGINDSGNIVGFTDDGNGHNVGFISDSEKP